MLGEHLPCMQLHLSLVPCAQGWGDRGDRQRGHGEGRAHSRALSSGRVPSRLWQTRACGSRRPEGLRGVCAPALLPHLPGAGRGRHTPVEGQVTAGREVRPGPGQHPCGPCHSLGLHDSPTSFLGRRGRKKALGRSLPPALNGLAAWSKADMDIRATHRTPHPGQPGIPQRGGPGWLQAAPAAHMSAKERLTVTCRPRSGRR